VELGQCGAGGLDGDLDVVSGFVDPAVEPTQLRDQIRGQCAQCLAGGVSGAHGTQQLSGPIGVQVTAGATRDQVGENGMESVDGLCPGLHQVVAVFDERKQSRCCRVDFSGVERLRPDEKDSREVSSWGEWLFQDAWSRVTW
jgi:hypothetical protein